jgi:O-antigen/teichoic acid export membrane protein
MIWLPAFLRARLRGREGVHKTIHNGSWLALDKAVRIVIGIIVSASVARYLGPSQFGELSYVIAFLTFFYAIATLGVENIVVRDLAQNPNQSPAVLGTTMLMRFVVGVACALGAIGLLIWSDGIESEPVLLAVLACGFLIFQAADVVDLWFQSQVQSGFSVKIRLINYLFFSGLKVLLILTQSPLVAFALIYSIEAIATGMSLVGTYYWASRKRLVGDLYHQKLLTVRVTLAVSILKESWPFILSALAVSASSRIDIILIKQFLGGESVGIYATAQTLVTIGTLFPGILYSSMLPALSRFKTSNHERFIQSLQKLYQVAVIWGVISSAALFLFADWIVMLIYGPAYQEAGFILKILSLANIFTSLGVVQAQWLYSEKGNRILFIQTLVAGVSAFILNAIFIPMWGLMGAAFAYVFVQFFSFFLINCILQKEIFKMQLKAFYVWRTFRYFNQ